MKDIIDIQLWQMASAYLFVLLVLLILRWRKIPREKELLISSIRMTLQLIITGYLLVKLFDLSSPVYTLLVLMIMEIFAIFTVYKRAKFPLSSRLKGIIALSMIIGTVSCLFFFLLVVINLSPWYLPQYFIPIAGMIIGNSMTGISLGVNRLSDGMKNQKEFIEGTLMLGATPHAATKFIVDDAFDSAILPTINSMLGIGIVFLPGMMTGQILSGVSPLVAIKYQIVIMLGILGSVALTVILFVQLGYRTFFNKQDQLEI